MSTLRRRAVLSLWSLAALGAGTLACSDPMGLGDSSGIVGTFILLTVDGEPLPPRGRIEGLGTTAEILADTLIVLDRVWEQSRHVRSGDLDGGGESLQFEQERSGVITRVEDGRFMLGSIGCDDVGDCLPNEVFEARNDTLVIDVSSDFHFRNLRFVRTSQEANR